MRTKSTRAAVRADRLRQMLTDGHSELQDGLRARLRDCVEHVIEPQDVADQSDAANQKELTFALLQMRTEALARVRQALGRLDAGQFGSCCDCDERISDARLRAQPFAVRCTACEQRREQSRAPYQGSEPQFGGVLSMGEDSRHQAGWAQGMVDMQTDMERTRRS